MKKVMRKRLSAVIAAIVLCACMLLPTTAHAAMADEAYAYEWGHTYEFISNGYSRYYRITLSEKSMLYVVFTHDENSYRNGSGYVYDTAGNKVIDEGDFIQTQNTTTGIWTATADRVLPSGTYYIRISIFGSGKNVSFFATAEPEIILDTPEISSISSPSDGTITTAAKTVKNALVYEYQYSKDTDFTDPISRDSASETLTADGFTGSDYYYVRVRTYAVYSNGSRVYSNWSKPKSVRVKESKEPEHAKEEISLSTPSISDISSPEEGTIEVSSSPVENALVYEFQFSSDAAFTSPVSKESPAETITADGFTDEAYYYVRVRAYTVDNDGSKIYSSWSKPKSVQMTKADNEVTIATSSKTLKYSSLKKKKQSFWIVADDDADAVLKYSISDISSKAKKYISISKSTGKVTVKRGLKKGTYKFTVTVTASPTGTYNSASAEQIITMKVK